MVVREGPQIWIANEVKETHDLAFRFVSKTEPADYATRLANAMHIYPRSISHPPSPLVSPSLREHIISGDTLVYDTEGGLELIRHLLETYFKPDKCIVMVKCKEFQGKTSLEER